MNTVNAITSKIFATVFATVRDMSDEQRFLVAALPIAACIAGLHLFCPAEQVFWFWRQFFFVATFVAAFGPLAILTGLITYNFGKGLTIRLTDGQPVLTAGDAMKGLYAGINIAPDILIITDHDQEPGAAVHERLKQAIDQRRPEQWVVCITYRHPGAVIVTNDDSRSMLFSRSTPPYQGPDWPEHVRIRPEGYRYENETWAEYQDYLQKFLSHYPEWARLQKPALSTNPLNAFMNTLSRATTLIALILLCSAAAVAQSKTAQLKAYLGEDRAQYFAPQAGPVKFVFDDATLERRADGSATIIDLLHADPYYTDANNMGRLLAVVVSEGGKLKLVPKQKPSAPAPAGGGTPGASSLTPVSALPVKRGGTFWDNIPDSSELEVMKAAAIAGKKEFGRELRPRQQFVDWCFKNFALPILFLIGVVAFYIAKVSSEESAISRSGWPVFSRSMSGPREWSVFVLSCDCWVVGIYTIVMDAVSTFFSDTTLWWWIARSLFVLFLTYRFTRWIIPNPRIIRTGGGSYQNSDAPLQING